MRTKKKFSISFFGISEKELAYANSHNNFGKFPKTSLDLYQTKGLLFVIADGINGQNDDSEVIRSAIEIVSREYFASGSPIVTSTLFSAFKTANLKIYQSFQHTPQYLRKGISCGALVLHNNIAYIANVGDTSVFRINDKNFADLINQNKDEDTVGRNPTENLNKTESEYAKTETIKALGIDTDVDIDILKDIPITEGDNFLLCNCKLDQIDSSEIKKIVLNYTPETACEKLIDKFHEKSLHNDVTLQIIRVEIAKNNNFMDFRRNNNAFKLRNYKLYIFILLAASILLTGIIYRDAILNLFSGRADLTSQNKLKPIKLKANEPIIPDPLKSMLKTAESFLNSNNLDSALITYNIILKKYPANNNAIKGEKTIFGKYVEKGNKLFNMGDSEGALKFYNKALSIYSNDYQLTDRVQFIVNELDKNILLKKENPAAVLPKPARKKIKVTDSKIINNDLNKETNSLWFNPSDWTVDGLTNKDFSVDGAGINFFNNSTIKKVLTREASKDINISVNIKFSNIPPGARAGIIFGYDSSEETGGERYLLFVVENGGNFALLNVKNGQEEILKSFKSSAGLYNDNQSVRIKIKSLGPWVIIYLDDKLLGSWYGKDFVKGEIGFYSGPNTNVAFNSFTLSSAFTDN